MMVPTTCLSGAAAHWHTSSGAVESESSLHRQSMDNIVGMSKRAAPQGGWSTPERSMVDGRVAGKVEAKFRGLVISNKFLV